MCGSVRVGGKNLKNVWWNDVVNAATERQKAAMEGVTKQRYMEAN